MNSEIITLLVATFPVLESRAAIPLALYLFRMSNLKALIISVFGNIVIVPVVFFLLKFLESKLVEKSSFAQRISEKIIKNLRRKYSSLNFKNLLGLSLFVAIPFPGTGAWSGTLLSYFLGLSLKTAFFFISIGVVFGAILILFLTKIGILIEKNWGLEALLFFLCMLSLFLLFFKKDDEKGK